MSSPQPPSGGACRAAQTATGLLVGVLAAAALSACAPQTEAGAGPGESNLRPSFDAQGDEGDDKAQRRKGKDKRTKRQQATQRPSDSNQAGADGTADSPAPTGASGSSSPPPADPPDQQPSSSGSPDAPSSSRTPAGAGPLRARISDPRGDTSGGLGGAPAHVDLVGATVIRSDGGFEVRVDVAGSLPPQQEGSRTQNVAVFYDLDGDGQVDYETWGALSDSGWSGSYRTPDSARFGRESGVRARPEGATLVITFPLSHLRDATSFRWQVGTEWGTYEQVASGTTTSDRAGGNGAAFPG